MFAQSSSKWKTTIRAYLFMAPALILLLVFVFYPIAYSLPLAFYNYSVIGDTTFAGWDNFQRALNDRDFWKSLWNSILFVLVVPPLQLISILVAVIVNRKIPGITLIKVLMYIPVVTSMIAVSIIWSFLLDQHGAINQVLDNLHLITNPIYFLNNVKTALLSLMFVTIWQGIGYYMMLYLGGLQSIPADLDEAASIDGANKFTIFTRITLPMLKPYIWFCSLISIISAVGVFDIVFAMTSGGPDKSTLVVNYYSYQVAFLDFEFGYASAVGLLASIVTTAISIVIFIYGRKGGMGFYD